MLDKLSADKAGPPANEDFTAHRVATLKVESNERKNLHATAAVHCQKINKT